MIPKVPTSSVFTKKVTSNPQFISTFKIATTVKMTANLNISTFCVVLSMIPKTIQQFEGKLISTRISGTYFGHRPNLIEVIN